MTARTAAGTRIFLGTTATSPTGDTFTEIGEVTNIGEFAKMYAKIEHKPINSRRVQKFKGSFDEGALQLKVAYDPTDPGQIAVDTAADSDSAYNVKIVLNDGASGSPSQGTTFDFKAMIMGFKKGVQGVDAVVDGSIDMEITSAITKTAAV